MNKRKIKMLWLGLGIPAILLGVPYIIFLLTLGSENMPGLNVWLLMGSFFLFFGAIVWLFKFASEKLFAKSEENPKDWEIIRLEGKWKYVLTLFAQLCLGIIIPLSIGFFVPNYSGTASLAQLVIAYLLLVLITIAGSFIISLEIWKTKEHEFLKRHSEVTDATNN